MFKQWYCYIYVQSRGDDFSYVCQKYKIKETLHSDLFRIYNYEKKYEMMETEI